MGIVVKQSTLCYFLFLKCLSLPNVSCWKPLFILISVPFSSFSIRIWNLSVRSLILAAVCISIAVVWGVYRNEDRYFYRTQAHKTHNSNSARFSPYLDMDATSLEIT